MTTPPNQSPWKVFGDKLANLFIEAIDEGVAEAKRKAATPPPNVVPLRRDLDEDLRTGRDAASTEESSTPTEACRAVAAETRSLTASLHEAVEEVAADLAGYVALQPMRDHANTLRKVMAYAMEGYDAIAKALNDLAEDLATKQSHALATVQALHSDGMISDEAAAALNKALEVEE